MEIGGRLRFSPVRWPGSGLEVGKNQAGPSATDQGRNWVTFPRGVETGNPWQAANTDFLSVVQKHPAFHGWPSWRRKNVASISEPLGFCNRRYEVVWNERCLRKRAGRRWGTGRRNQRGTRSRLLVHHRICCTLRRLFVGFLWEFRNLFPGAINEDTDGKLGWRI